MKGGKGDGKYGCARALVMTQYGPRRGCGGSNRNENHREKMWNAFQSRIECQEGGKESNDKKILFYIFQM